MMFCRRFPASADTMKQLRLEVKEKMRKKMNDENDGEEYLDEKMGEKIVRSIFSVHEEIPSLLFT